MAKLVQGVLGSPLPLPGLLKTVRSHGHLCPEHCRDPENKPRKEPVCGKVWIWRWGLGTPSNSQAILLPGSGLRDLFAECSGGKWDPGGQTLVILL